MYKNVVKLTGYIFFQCFLYVLFFGAVAGLGTACHSAQTAANEAREVGTGAFDNAAQKNLIERFSKAYFRGEKEAAFYMLEKKDRDIIAEPLSRDSLKTKEERSVLNKLKPWDLLEILDITNPYDIKSIEPQQSFTSIPAKFTTSDVIVNRYNGTPQKYSLIWDENRWNIHLGL